MAVIMATIRPMDMAFLFLDRCFEFGLGHRAVADLGFRKQEVDDLVLIQRCAQLGRGHRLLLDILHEALAILGIILRRCLLDQAVHFGRRDLDTVALPDFGEQQTQTYATLGN